MMLSASVGYPSLPGQQRLSILSGSEGEAEEYLPLEESMEQTDCICFGDEAAMNDIGP